MGNAFYDGIHNYDSHDDDAQVSQVPRERKYLTTKHGRDLYLYRNILTGAYKRQTCAHLNPFSSEKCGCAPLISKIIRDNLMRTKRRLAKMYAIDELGNYNYCFAALVKCGFNQHVLRKMRSSFRLKAISNAPEGYRVASAELVRKYNLYACVVSSDEVSGSYLLKIPDPFANSE